MTKKLKRKILKNNILVIILFCVLIIASLYFINKNLPIYKINENNSLFCYFLAFVDSIFIYEFIRAKRITIKRKIILSIFFIVLLSSFLIIGIIYQKTHIHFLGIIRNIVCVLVVSTIIGYVILIQINNIIKIDFETTNDLFENLKMLNNIEKKYFCVTNSYAIKPMRKVSGFLFTVFLELTIFIVFAVGLIYWYKSLNIGMIDISQESVLILNVMNFFIAIFLMILFISYAHAFCFNKYKSQLMLKQIIYILNTILLIEIILSLLVRNYSVEIIYISMYLYFLVLGIIFDVYYNYIKMKEIISMKYFVDNIEEPINDLSMSDKEICNSIIKYKDIDYPKTRNLYGYSTFENSYVKNSMKTLFLINKYFYLLKLFKMPLINPDEYYEWIIKIDMQQMSDLDKILIKVKSYLETYIIKNYGYPFKGTKIIKSFKRLLSKMIILNIFSNEPCFEKKYLPRTQVIFDHYDGYVNDNKLTLKLIQSMYELGLDVMFISEEKVNLKNNTFPIEYVDLTKVSDK